MAPTSTSMCPASASRTSEFDAMAAPDLERHEGDEQAPARWSGRGGRSPPTACPCVVIVAVSHAPSRGPRATAPPRRAGGRARRRPRRRSGCPPAGCAPGGPGAAWPGAARRRRVGRPTSSASSLTGCSPSSRAQMTRSRVSSARSLSIPTAERNSSPVDASNYLRSHADSVPRHRRGPRRWHRAGLRVGRGEAPRSAERRCTLQGWLTDALRHGGLQDRVHDRPGDRAPSELLAAAAPRPPRPPGGCWPGQSRSSRCRSGPVVGSVCAVPVLTAAHR